MKVLLTWQATPDEIATVQESLPPGSIVAAPPSNPRLGRYEAATADLLRLCVDADVLFGWIIPKDVIEAAHDLQLIVWNHAGVDSLPLDLIHGRGIKLANAAGAFDVGIAEEAIMFMFAAAKQLIPNNRALIDALWIPPLWDGGTPLWELEGRTVTVIGVGRLGGLVAKKATALGMTVLGVRRNAGNRTGVSEGWVKDIYGADSLHEALGLADFVVLCVPLTASTERLMDEKALRAMQSHAWLVNVARGNLVDEAAIYQALTEGWIAGFASEVWWDYTGRMPPGQHYQIPSRLGVHRLPNVIGNGDRGSNTIEARNRGFAFGVANVAAHARGESLRHVVDLSLGY